MKNSISSTLETIVLTNDILKRQSAFLRKRAGDWLQVLSCLDKERFYNINGEVKKLTDCNIYFCSSDRVAIAFALYNDISCILKQNSGYSYYKSKRVPNTMASESMKQFYNYQRNADKYIPLLKEGLEIYKSSKEKWGKELETISSTTSLDEIKQLVYLAFHCISLSSFYTSDHNLETIEKFIADPFDPIFDKNTKRDTVNSAIERFERSNIRFKDLRTDYVPDNDEYFKLFDFRNVSHESLDLVYGASLFKILLGRNETESFAVQAMYKVMEILNYDENIVALYTLLVETHREHTDDYQVGGGNKDKPSSGTTHPALLATKQSLIATGEYLTNWLLMRHRLIKPIPTFKHALDIKLPGHGGFRLGNINVRIINHLIYKYNIIPKDYIKFVDYDNSFYGEDEEGPSYEIAQFLKRLQQQQPVQRQPRTVKRLPEISVHRRRKTRRGRRRS